MSLGLGRRIGQAVLSVLWSLLPLWFLSDDYTLSGLVFGDIRLVYLDVVCGSR
jgi:hypothetical protein